MAAALLVVLSSCSALCQEAQPRQFKLAGISNVTDYSWGDRDNIYVTGTNAAGDGALFVVDVRNGEASQVKTIPEKWDLKSLTVSPNGKYLLFADDKDNHTSWAVTDLNGKPIARAKARKWYLNMRGLWFANSKGWCERVSHNTGTDLILYTLDAEQAHHRFEPAVRAVHIAESVNVIGLTWSGAVVATAKDHTHDGVLVRTYKASPNANLQTNAAFTLADGTVIETSFVPEGNKLCWLVLNTSEAGIGQPNAASVSIYTSELDCTQKRLVSKLLLRDADMVMWRYRSGVKNPEIPTNVRMSPDGSHITFIRNGGLWEVTVPRSK
jgi:dipeptidyl aminopeptidase/acylaminoacyl peptidase